MVVLQASIYTSIYVESKAEAASLKKVQLSLDYLFWVTIFAAALTHGVIGNTPVFGSGIQGSSPCGST